MAHTDSGASEKPSHAIFVWDGPTRLFHWLTAVLIVIAYVTYRLDWMNAHAMAGYAVLTLIAFRLLWGFFGSETARFSRFVTAPHVALAYLKRILHREPDRQVGHNAAGAWMVLLLLALVLGEALSGVYVQNDVANQGPLTEVTPARIANAITATHWIFWYALLGAILLHVVAIVVYAAAKGQDLLRPMITGWKMLPANVAQPPLASLLRAVLLLGISALAVVALVNLV